MFLTALTAFNKLFVLK